MAPCWSSLAHKTSFSLAYRTVKYDYESVVYGDKLRCPRAAEQAGELRQSLVVSTRRRRKDAFSRPSNTATTSSNFASQAAIGDSRSGAAYAGLDFSRLGRRVRGRVRVGYKKFDVRAVDGPDYQGIVGDSQLSIRLARPFVIRGSYVRDVRFSLWYNNPYYIESRPGAGASVYVFRFLRLDYDYSIGRNRYP